MYNFIDVSIILVIFSSLGSYGYQVVTVGEVEAKPEKEMSVTTMMVSVVWWGRGIYVRFIIV